MSIFKSTITLFILLTLAACGGTERHHSANLPDPQQFNAHFGDIDANQNDLLDRDEMKAHFPQADDSVYDALDLNQDGAIDHDEWHEFKQAHGMHH